MKLRLLLVGVLIAVSGALLVPVPTAAAAARPTVAVVGDSYTAGEGARYPATQAGAWWRHTAAVLGWRPTNIVANPGAGYVMRGAYGTLAQSLANHPIPADTDFVLVQGGYNDYRQSNSADVPAGVAKVLSLIRKQAPRAVPIVIGSFAPRSDQLVSASQIPVARNIGAYTAIGSTRYMIGFMCPFEVARDGIHPTALGHRQIGEWVAWHLQHGMDNGTELVLDPTGSFWVAP